MSAEHHNEISAALAAAQAEMSNPGFDSTNPHFRSKFASLAAVRKAVIPVLSKHGIALTQELTTRTAVEKDVIFFDEKVVDGAVVTSGGKPVYERAFHDVNVCWVGCIVTLMHTSGQYIRCVTFEVPAGEMTAQQICAASTYLRRYSMQSVAGVVGEEDDDGQEASRPRPASTYKPATTPPPQPDSPTRARGFINNLAAAGTVAQVKAISEQAQAQRGYFLNADWDAIVAAGKAAKERLVTSGAAQ